MSIILCIETATSVCSVALAATDKPVRVMTSSGANDHSEKLLVMVDSLLNEAGISLSALDAVAVSSGPGSYTGLRIGVSAAKGICYSLDIPYLSISTLQAMTAGLIAKYEDQRLPGRDDILFVPMIDARRMEVYSAVFDMNNKLVRGITAEIITESSFNEYFDHYRLIFFGDGAQKCILSLQHQSNASFVEGFDNSAGYMANMALKQYEEGNFEDVAYVEPYYLKDFIAGAPKVKGLRETK